MKRMLSVAVLAASLLVPNWAQAADFPTRPVTIIAGFNAGGTSDIILRAMAPELEKELGQPVLIVNKGGSGGAIAIGDLLTKDSDGYTVGLVLSAAFTLDVQTKKARYSMDDFKFLGMAGMVQEGFFCLTDKPWKDFKGMIEYAKKEGKPLTFASPAIIDTLIMKAIGKKEGVSFRKVPVKSGGETATNVLGGHVDIGYGGGIQIPYVQAGKMINLAATTVTPLVKFPECPTLLSLGYDGTCYDNFYGFFVKKDTPEDVCNKLSETFYKVVRLPSIQDAIANKANLSPKVLERDELLPLMKQQFEDYKALLAASK